MMQPPISTDASTHLPHFPTATPVSQQHIKAAKLGNHDCGLDVLRGRIIGSANDNARMAQSCVLKVLADLWCEAWWCAVRGEAWWCAAGGEAWWCAGGGEAWWCWGVGGEAV